MADNVSLLLAQLVAQLATAWRTQVAPRQCADLLLRLDAVLTFAGHDALHQGFARCAQRLVLARIDASLVHADELPHLWHTLWKLPQLPPVDAEYVHDCNDLALWQAVQADLATHRWQLQQFLQQAAQEQEPRLSYDILLLHYRLPWVVAAAGNAALADYCRLWLHVLLAHWRPQLPLPREVIVLLRDTAALLDLAQWQTLDAASLCRQQLRLLAQSPESLPPGVEVSIAGHPGAVPLGGIPALLATAFDVLMQVRAEWFATADNLELHATRLEAELRFLEQAAAAIRMTVVETMASLVLALLRQVQRLDVMQQWPGALLWRAHRHLLDLLDEAAAWQQPQPDQELLTELRSWLRQAHHDSYRLREPRVDSDALLILSDRLHRFVDAMTLTLDQPVHFTVTVSGMLPVELLASGEIALQTLLREEILVQVQAMPQRRQSLKPRAVAMQLQLHACAASIVAELKSEAVGTALDIATLKRLRRNLPPRAQQVQAEESVANGRRLGLVIAG